MTVLSTFFKQFIQTHEKAHLPLEDSTLQLRKKGISSAPRLPASAQSGPPATPVRCHQLPMWPKRAEKGVARGPFYVTGAGSPRPRVRPQHRGAPRGARPHVLATGAPAPRPTARRPARSPRRPAPSARPSGPRTGARGAAQPRPHSPGPARGARAPRDTAGTAPWGRRCGPRRLAGKCAPRGAGVRASHPDGPSSGPAAAAASAARLRPRWPRPRRSRLRPGPQLAAAPRRPLPAPPPRRGRG